jgi:hypothetical protein
MGHIPSRILGEVCHVDSPVYPGLTEWTFNKVQVVQLLLIMGSWWWHICFYGWLWGIIWVIITTV